MRSFLFVLLVSITTCSYSQNIKKNVDKFTGDSLYSGELQVGNVFIILSFKPKSDNIDVVFKYLKPSCVDDNAQMFFLFTEGTRANDISAGRYNCDGLFFLKVGNRSTDLRDLLHTKNIKSIRLVTTKSFIDFDLTTQQAILFKKNFLALFNKWFYD